MVILKKIKSATLIETLIATVLIVVVFLMASMIINTIFFNTFHQKKELVMNRLDELEYEYINKSLELPFLEEIENWNIEIIKLNQITNCIFNYTDAIYCVAYIVYSVSG